MAGRWRKLLQQESEHQWLAISLFFIFAIIGGIAIEGTSTLAGVELGAGDAQHDGYRVLDVVYFDNNEGLASQLVHIYDPTQGHYLYSESNDVSEMIYQPGEYDKGDEIRFINELSDNRAMMSIASNQLVEVTLNQRIAYININSSDDFWVDDYKEINGPDSAMMVTMEDNGVSSIRAASFYFASPAMTNSNSVNWQEVVHLSQNKWVATGTITSTQSSGNSPASPTVRTAIGIVEWQGDVSIAPVLTSFTTGDEGQVHSVLSTGDSVIVAANTGAYLISSDASLSTLDLPSQAAISDSDGRTWFIGYEGTDSIATYDGEIEIKKLANPISLDIEIAQYESGVIFIHGMDADGHFEMMTIDTTVQDSIESGRGFLNFAFITFASMILVVMAWTVVDRVRNY